VTASSTAPLALTSPRFVTPHQPCDTGDVQTLAVKNGGASIAYVGALYAFADTGFAWRWVDDTPVGNLADATALWGGGPAYSG
jgi:hypothetical protein